MHVSLSESKDIINILYLQILKKNELMRYKSQPLKIKDKLYEIIFKAPKTTLKINFDTLNFTLPKIYKIKN